MTASAAARRMSSGPGSSGKPWPRLMALLSRAACDIASKMVTGRSAKTLFIEIIFGKVLGSESATGLGRQSRGLPAQDAPGQMLVVGQSRRLRGERGRHRAFSRSAGKHHLLALRIWKGGWIETRQRNDHPCGIGLDHHLVGLADIDQEIASVRHALRDFLRRQILHFVIRHAQILPTADRPKSKPTISGAKSPLAPGKSSAANGLSRRLNLDRDLRSNLDHPAGRDLEIVGGVVGGAAEPDEEKILPARHAGMDGRLQGAT